MIIVKLLVTFLFVSRCSSREVRLNPKAVQVWEQAELANTVVALATKTSVPAVNLTQTSVGRRCGWTFSQFRALAGSPS